MMLIRAHTSRQLLFLFLFCIIAWKTATAQNENGTRIIHVDTGWASNSVNVTIFRRNSLVSHGDTQFIAFYDKDRYVVLGKRKLGSGKWSLKRTPYQGNANDAHNVISIMTDGDGYLHMAWDHHNNKLHYCKSVQPGSLEMSEQMPMTGITENKVSYPEFYKMPGGNILFFYRDGGSGGGNLILNRYDVNLKKWEQLHSNLVDGEGQRNAYWQACVDSKGTLHLSWVWRESPDVASNHDLGYARSKDGGRTWEKSTGEKYQLPVNAAKAEYAVKIPQSSELINQTSMYADASGVPYIATYWREAGSSVPQYQIIYKNSKNWKTVNLQFRKTPFSLSGGGTKRIPISRPQVIAWPSSGKLSVAVIFRDVERGDKVSIAVCDDIAKSNWRLKDLSKAPVGSWEPTYDTELWKKKKLLHLFVQRVEQVDAEGKADFPPQPVQVLEWQPGK